MTRATAWAAFKNIGIIILEFVGVVIALAACAGALGFPIALVISWADSPELTLMQLLVAHGQWVIGFLICALGVTFIKVINDD